MKRFESQKVRVWTLFCKQLGVIQHFEQTVIHSNVYSAQVQLTLLGTMENTKVKSPCSLLWLFRFSKWIQNSFRKVILAALSRMDWRKETLKLERANNRQCRVLGQTENQSSKEL